MTDPLLQFHEVRCERDGYSLFAPVSLAVHAGEIVQLEGPNGVGKTTLLRSLCGLASRWTGDIHWRGVALERDRFAVETLFLGHATGLKLALSPRQNLRWWGALRGREVGPAVDEALLRVGLCGYEDLPCYQLSAGQQRRVALARLFLVTVPLWILDEPFTAIDRHGVAELEGWLVAHAAAGNAVLLTTHQPLSLPVPIRQFTLMPESDCE